MPQDARYIVRAGYMLDREIIRPSKNPDANPNPDPAPAPPASAAKAFKWRKPAGMTNGSSTNGGGELMTVAGGSGAVIPLMLHLCLMMHVRSSLCN